MCSRTLNVNKVNDKTLNSLKVDQLFSVEILIENVIILHGPYKNAGDLDHITDSSEEEKEDEGNEITVGMAMVECAPCCSPYMCVKQKKPRIKKTCHTIAIDSWAPGVISSKIYNPEESCECQIRKGPPELCQTCIDRSVKRPKDKQSDDCQCEKEYCYSFPIDSWGPKIRSSSGIDKKKCRACKKFRRSEDDGRGGRTGRGLGKVGQNQAKAMSAKGGSAKGGSAKGGSAKGGSSKGSTKSDLGKGMKGKGTDKGKSKKKDKTVENLPEDEEPPEEPPKPKPKKKFCPRPPMPEGPLPPIRLSISLLHMKDIKINQVDIEKLYPPEDEDPSLDLDDDNDEIDYNGSPITNKGQETPQSVNKKTTGNLSRVSDSSKQSKNIFKSAENDRSKKNFYTAPSSTTAETDYDSDYPMLDKYRELGMSDNAKCSEDLESKQRTIRKQQRAERDKRKEIIQSLRATTDFKRGISFVFASFPLDIISKLMVEKLEIVVERSNNKEPVYPIGKVKITLPTICRERVQAGARINTKKPLWTCFEDNYPVIDCKGKEVGTMLVYCCITSLGHSMVSSSLISDNNLYEYIDLAKYIGQDHTGVPTQTRATAFTTCYGNLHQVTHRDFNKPKKTMLHF